MRPLFITHDDQEMSITYTDEGPVTDLEGLELTFGWSLEFTAGMS